MMKQITLFSVFFLFFLLSSTAQEYDIAENPENIRLVNSLDTSRIINLIGNATMTVRFSVPFKDTAIAFTRMVADGFIRSSNDSSVHFVRTVWRTDIKYKGENRVRIKYDRCFEWDSIHRLGVPQYIRMADVYSLGYRNPRRQYAFSIGYTICFLSALVGITGNTIALLTDSKKGEGLMWAGYGAMIGVSFPLMIIGKQKTYKITPKGDNYLKDHWYFETHN